MGTDIHPIVEVREDKDTPWQIVKIPKAEGSEWANVLDSRNYNVFAILANVRNGYGFAGVPTGSGFPYISDVRGIPEDAGFTMNDKGYILCPTHSPHAITDGSISKLPVVIEEEGEEDCYGCNACEWLGDHSYTWVTLREIIDYDWDGGVETYGVVSEAEYKHWTDSGDIGKPPHFYSGAVSGFNVQTLHEEAYLLGSANYFKGKSIYIRFARTITRRESVGRFLEEGVEWLKTLGDPDNVRIIMGFDS